MVKGTGSVDAGSISDRRTKPTLLTRQCIKLPKAPPLEFQRNGSLVHSSWLHWSMWAFGAEPEFWRPPVESLTPCNVESMVLCLRSGQVTKAVQHGIQPWQHGHAPVPWNWCHPHCLPDKPRKSRVLFTKLCQLSYLNHRIHQVKKTIEFTSLAHGVLQPGTWRLDRADCADLSGGGAMSQFAGAWMWFFPW